MKIIIAGGRDFIPQQCHWDWLNELRKHYSAKNIVISEVVSGCQRGADRLGEDWAKNRDIPVKSFPAAWQALGSRAGPVRNAAMADYLLAAYHRGETVAVILFPGGRGTQSMHNEAKKRELTIYDWRERVE